MQQFITTNSNRTTNSSVEKPLSNEMFFYGTLSRPQALFDQIVEYKRQLITIRIAYIGAIEPVTVLGTIARNAFIGAAKRQRERVSLFMY